jgi:hypothetical protein
MLQISVAVGMIRSEIVKQTKNKVLLRKDMWIKK